MLNINACCEVHCMIQTVVFISITLCPVIKKLLKCQKIFIPVFCFSFPRRRTLRRFGYEFPSVSLCPCLRVCVCIHTALRLFAFVLQQLTPQPRTALLGADLRADVGKEQNSIYRNERKNASSGFVFFPLIFFFSCISNQLVIESYLYILQLDTATLC